MKEPRDLGQGKGHAGKGFPGPLIAMRNLSHFWEKTKPRRVNIKVPRPSKCPFKTLREDHGTLILKENLDFS